ncbi:MAG: iron chelate uptake ABC transporter family permease subunit [Nitriliruptorales bacterium]|nr:iron chelate uptake ABC transporter family permease subunit [Nitriliruptorales bacterium]
MRPGWVLAGIAAVVAAALLGVTVGPVRIGAADALRSVVGLPSGLDPLQRAILHELRLPRVVLGLLVGGTLSLCGAGYQAVFRNPLADPYLLGAAAGAGLGVTLVITGAAAGAPVPLSAPVAAFAGSLAAVALTWLLGAASGARGSTAALILAGVAVGAFLTALQTFLQQRDVDTIRTVYSWILGRLSTAGWRDVAVVTPYAAAAATVLLVRRRVLDVLAVGDDEAATLGVHPTRVRVVVVAAASLGTAAAVSVSGLIGFVGIIVPHTVRLLAGTSNRVVLPLSVMFGGSFLCLTDLLARTLIAPAEIPIGVVTAFFGAPFFVLVLRTSRRGVGG